MTTAQETKPEARESAQPLAFGSTAGLGPAFLHARNGGAAYPADLVRTWPERNRARFVVPLYDQDALDAAVAAARDCRTCAHHTYASGGCVSALRCVGGDRYQPTQPRQLWEQRPTKPAPF